MRKNVGLFEAFLRTMIGFSMFGKGINWRSSIMVGLGSMLIATGITLEIRQGNSGQNHALRKFICKFLPFLL